MFLNLNHDLRFVKLFFVKKTFFLRIIPAGLEKKQENAKFTAK